MGIRQLFHPSVIVRDASEWIEAKVDPLFHGPTYQLIEAEAKLRPEDDLLDVVCGAGDFLAYHAAHVRQVAGLDISDLRVRMARRRLADRIAAGTARIAAGDAGALPWPDDTFSTVTCMASLELWEKLGWSVWTETDVQRMMSEAGFARVSISYGRWNGNSRLLGALIRFMAGTGEGRFVHATKPDSHHLQDEAGDEDTWAVDASQNMPYGLAGWIDARLMPLILEGAGS